MGMSMMTRNPCLTLVDAEGFIHLRSGLLLRGYHAV